MKLNISTKQLFLLLGCFSIFINENIAQDYHALNGRSTSLTGTTAPVVHDDQTMVLLNSEVVFDALQNDEYVGRIEEVSIIKGPVYGTVFIENDNSFTYIPDPEICDVKDEFTYLIGNGSGEASGKIKVDVLCQEITIISSFSPDNDGVNDYFEIQGAERFPQSILTVFDQFGEVLYKTSGYKNNWDGKVNGKPLQNNLYLFTFDDGNANMYTGNLKIERAEKRVEAFEE